MLGRVATFSQTNRLVQATMAVQAKLAAVQEQEASGAKAPTYGQLGSDTGRLLTLSTRSAALDAENAAIDKASSVANGAYSAVGSLNSLATSIRSQLASAISGNGDVSSLASNAANWLSDLQSLLNSDTGGVQLFSGSASDKPAVDFSSMTSTADPDAADTSYYQGASQPLTYNRADAQSVTLSVSADDPSIEKLVRGLRVLAQASETSDVSEAYDLISSASDGLATTQQSLSVTVNSLEDAKDRNSSEKSVVDDLASKIDGADLSRAAVLVVQYQTQIETLYSTISKLSSLSLSKYL